jgi:hypothetical protein
MNSSLFWVVLVSIILVLVFTQKSNKLQYTYTLTFAGSNFANACFEIGTLTTLYSNSNVLEEGVAVFLDELGLTPAPNGWYGQYEGSRIPVTNGISGAGVGCA